MKTKLLLVIGYLLAVLALVVLVLINIRGAASIQVVSRAVLAYAIGILILSALFLGLAVSIRSKNPSQHFNSKRVSGIVFVTIMVVTLLLPLAGLAAGIENKLANYENRTLAKMPEIKIENPFQLGRDFQAYFTDNFGFRKLLIQWNSILKVQYFHTSTVGNVMLGKQDWLYYQPSLNDAMGSILYTDQQLNIIRQNLVKESDWLNNMGIPYLIVIAPDKETIYPEYLPDTVKGTGKVTKIDQLSQYVSVNSNLHILDLRKALLEAKSNSQVYYATDTHWNSYGAYIGYREIMQQLSFLFPNSPPNSEYTLIPQSIPFSGDLAAMLFLPDKFKEQAPQMIHEQSNSTKQFKLKKAVIFHDSFYVGLEPYLENNFDQIIQGTNGGHFDRNLIEQAHPDVVMAVFVARQMDEILKP